MSAAAETSGLVRMAEIEGRGRGLVASQPLKAGQIVLRDSPILLYSAFPLNQQSSLSSSSCSSTSNTYCARCFRALQSSSSSLPSEVPCPGCSRHHVFCSQNCLSTALTSSHSAWVCQALSRLRECPPLVLEQPTERQVQARFLVAAYHLALFYPSQFQILLSLEGAPNALDATAAQFLHSLISSLFPPHPPLEGFSVELTAALLAKDKLNAFGLMEPFSSPEDGQRSVRAYGIYPNASFFNHDCLPNACRFDYVDTAADHSNTDIIVRVIHDVPQGREICLSYFPVNENYASRQRRLKEDYGFTCRCDRCEVEANWSDQEDDEVTGEEEEEKEKDELMDEDHDEEIATSQGEGEADFPHAYFFVRYMCDRENCGGTMAPLAPKDDATPSDVFECNVCGKLKHDQMTDANGGEDEVSMDD